MQQEILEVAAELKQTLESVVGVKSVAEIPKLEYLIVVDTDENKANAEKVCSVLENQASKFDLQLEFLVVTEADMEDAKARYNEFLNKNKTMS